MSWGGLLQVAKPLLAWLDPFWLNTLRYGLSAPVFALLLVRAEGIEALNYEGRFLGTAVLGFVGFGGFGILTLLGVQGTRPEHAALIVALMPLVSMAIGWARGGERPSAFVLLCMLAGVFGVGLTASGGTAGSAHSGGGLVPALFVLAGVASWALYTQGSTRHGWSALRYTALSCIASLPGFLLLLCLASLVGWAHRPPEPLPVSAFVGLGYIVSAATLFGMVGWNGGIRRLGPVNGVLFINLVPVSAFAIGVIRGSRFSAAEWIGAGVVLATLLATNLDARRRAPL
jgi:drug/metabolite transporter (DMT)-like permease